MAILRGQLGIEQWVVAGGSDAFRHAETDAAAADLEILAGAAGLGEPFQKQRQIARRA